MSPRRSPPVVWGRGAVFERLDGRTWAKSHRSSPLTGPLRGTAPSTSRRARPRLIRDPTHPSYDPEAGQCGLFASRPLARGAWVLDYVGEVSAGGCEDRDSDYVSDFGERAELALDADKVEMDPNI